MNKNSISNTRKPGSTIDDSDRLAKIASLLASQPTLSLSDAIKSIGITDRASMRRLRGKYNRSSNPGGVIATRSVGSESGASKSMGKNRPAAAMALRASGTAKTKRSPKPAVPKSEPATGAPTKISKDTTKSNSAFANSPTSPYGMAMPPWFSIGMDLSAVAMHTQVQFYQQMMRMGPMTNLVKQQADMFKAMSGAYTKPTKRKAA